MQRPIIVLATLAVAGISGEMTSKAPADVSAVRVDLLCRDSSGMVGSAIMRLKGLAVATDTATVHDRDALYLDSVSPDSILRVADTVQCRRAAESFRRAKYGVDTGDLIPVHLVHYGGSRYVASNLSRIGEGVGWFVLDTSFAMLAAVPW